MQHHTRINLLSCIREADDIQLLDLLRKADVSIGHIRGRYISVQGYSGSVTFTVFFKRIEEIYQANVSQMQERQKKYEKEVKRRSGLEGLSHAIIEGISGAIISKISDTFLMATISPEISEYEEAIVTQMLKWREKIDAQFAKLYTKSQERLEQKASEKCSWLLIKAWDFFLNTKGAFQSSCKQDKKTLENMSQTRITRASLPDF